MYLHKFTTLPLLMKVFYIIYYEYLRGLFIYINVKLNLLLYNDLIRGNVLGVSYLVETHE